MRSFFSTVRRVSPRACLGLRPAAEGFSFRAAGRDCEEVGEALGEQGFALRAGLHCAPLAHPSAGTLETGTVRASGSAFNTPQEIGRFLDAMGRLAKG